MQKVIGTITKFIYASNNFSIFKLLSDGNEIICVYNSNDVEVDTKVCAYGEFQITQKYGERFQVEKMEISDLLEEKEIIRYLSSPSFAGIGSKLAKRIFKKFGDKTIDIINNDIDKIKEVEGIGEKKFLDIKSAISGIKDDKEIVLELNRLGFSISSSNKIYNAFHKDSIEVVKNDPYSLIDKIKGFSFRKADAIVNKMGEFKESYSRIEHGMIYVLKEGLKAGNTFLVYSEFISKSKEILRVKEEKIVEVYSDFLGKGIIIEKNFKDQGKDIKCVFLTHIYMSEYEVCSSLIRLYINKKKSFEVDIHKEIEEFEQNNNIKFSEDQKKALIGSVNDNVHIISGGPGTGKTTIIKFILNVFSNLGLKTMMVAPTGRAAKRMMETTGAEAKTIHRLLEISSTDEDEFEFDYRNDKKFIKCDVIIIDEASMIDIVLAGKLFSSLKLFTKVIIVGDIDQLPSVGPGNFLMDIIKSGIFPVSMLNKIYRQGENSYIVVNAHRINNGEELVLNKKDGDFFILKSTREDEVVEIIKELITDRIPNYFSNTLNVFKDIQIITPVRKGLLGTNNLNIVVKEAINKKTEYTQEMILDSRSYRVGDKVMQIKNNYEFTGYSQDGFKVKGVFNGDIGYVTYACEKSIKVIYDGNRVFEYDKSNLNELEHAYAITIHKSQGSEFPVVIIPMFKFASILMNRNILYTAVTRAKRFVILVGDVKHLMFMVKNKSSIVRYSSLKYLFSEFVKLLESE